MKRVMLTIIITLMVPSTLLAVDPMIGVYFEHGHLAYTPTAAVPFYGALYIVQPDPETAYPVTGIEYSLELSRSGSPITQDSPLIVAINQDGWPWQYAIEFGDIWGGHAVTYFPPLTGLPYGYSPLVSFEMIILEDCSETGEIMITVKEDPRSGYLRGTYAPDNELFSCVGLISAVCPTAFSNDEQSWGAIKAMYR